MKNTTSWFKKLITEMGRDFTSLRATWNWIYLALYVFLALYGAFKVKDSYSTIITVTGGVVSVLFTNYVLGKRGATVVQPAQAQQTTGDSNAS